MEINNYKEPLISIIILNWNGWKDTINCVNSILNIDYPHFNIVIVDNGSKDNSLNKMVKYFNLKTKNSIQFYDKNKQIMLLANSKNSGFAGGNNLAINWILKNFNSKYILLLNNDTIVKRDFLKEMIHFANQHKQIGALQPIILSMDNKKIIDSTGINLNKWGDAYQLNYKRIFDTDINEPKEVFGVSGAAMLLNTEMLKEIGLLDEDFFAYYEDVDLAWRARLFGWKAYYVPSSVVFHKHSASGSRVKYYYLSRNNLLYILKNGSFGILLKAFVKNIFFTFYKIINPYIYGQNNKIPISFARKMVFKGMIDSLYLMYKMIKKRKFIQKNKKIPSSVIESKWFYVKKDS